MTEGAGPRLTYEELCFITAGLGAEPPAALVGPSPPAFDDEVAVRSLVSRGLARVPEDGTVEIDGVVAEICRLLSEPAAVARLMGVGRGQAVALTMFAPTSGPGVLMADSVASGVWEIRGIEEPFVDLVRAIVTDKVQLAAPGDPLPIKLSKKGTIPTPRGLAVLPVDLADAQIWALQSADGEMKSASLTVWVNSEAGLYAIGGDKRRLELLPTDGKVIVDLVVEGLSAATASTGRTQ